MRSCVRLISGDIDIISQAESKRRQVEVII